MTNRTESVISDQSASEDDSMSHSENEVKKRKKSFPSTSFTPDFIDTSDSENETKYNEKTKWLKKAKRQHSSEVDGISQHKHSKISEVCLGNEPEFDFLKEDLHLSDSEEEYATKCEKTSNPSTNVKGKKAKQKIKMDFSDEVKKLKNFAPMATLYKDELAINQMNIKYCMTVIERIRRHLEVLSSNTLSEAIDTCAKCPQHCSVALLKSTKDRRGPKPTSKK